MHDLWIGTNNPKKLAELERLLSPLGCKLRTPKELGKPYAPVEDQPTFTGNARKKAELLAKLSGGLALADDSGICVDALGGQPDLIELEVMPADARLIRRLGASRSLRQLQMSFVADLSLDDLRPLAAVRSLRKLQLFECGEVSEVDVRALFGAEVEVRVTGRRSLRSRVR